MGYDNVNVGGVITNKALIALITTFKGTTYVN
jgi:hypothetical protein